jgi:hypothetical protein
MWFQNIVKGKYFWGRRMDVACVGTTSANRGCSASVNTDAPASLYLQSDALRPLISEHGVCSKPLCVTLLHLHPRPAMRASVRACTLHAVGGLMRI